MSATEDPWTNSTPTREYPLIRQYYELHGVEDALKNVHVNAGHNYNAETRAAVYEWFHRHLKPTSMLITDPAPISEEVAELGDLRVFPDKLLPENSVSGWQVIRNWIRDSERMYAESLPSSNDELDRFAAHFRPALQLVLSAHTPPAETLSVRSSPRETVDGFSYLRHQV